MIPKAYHRDLETLELTTGATLPEIRRAYLHLRELYSTESIASLPIIDEFPEEQRAVVLDEIESAYHRLSVFFDGQARRAESDRIASSAVKSPEATSGETRKFDGPTLKRIRETAGIDLEEISGVIRVPVHHLENIESENFERLPPAVFTRGFVSGLADYLGLDPRQVCDDYMNRRSEWDHGEKHRRSQGRFSFGWNRFKR